jgi:hypothetical protein
MAHSCNSIKTTVLPPSFDSDNPPDYSIIPSSSVKPPPASTGSDWVASPCNLKARYRYTDDGHIEVESVGAPRLEQWPGEVDEFRPFIESAADASGLSRALLAGLVAVESGGKPNIVSPEGRMGLAQIPRNVARMVANKDFPVDTSEVDVPDQQILHPVWNLAHAARALAYFLEQRDLNLVAGLAVYDRGDVKCEPNPDCPESRWGVLTDCDYVDQVIAATNTAVDRGYHGPRVLALGSEGSVVIETQDDEDESNVGRYLLFGALGAGAAFALSRLSKKRK